MEYTTIEFKDPSDWFKFKDNGIPKQGAYHIVVFRDNEMIAEHYFLNGEYHRTENKPANIWYLDGDIWRERYYVYGVLLVDIWHSSNNTQNKKSSEEIKN